MGEFALDNANLHRLETRSFELFNMVYINYYFGGHFDFFHDLRNSNTCVAGTGEEYHGETPEFI